MSQLEERIQDILREEAELPEVVCDKAGQAFLHIQQRKAESKQKHKGMKNMKAAVIALVIILSVGTPVAAAVKHFGLLDYFNQRDENLPEEAVEMIVDDVEQGEMTNEEDTLVNFRIREYLYDIMQVYLVIEAKPTDERYMLIPQWSVESDPVEDLNIDGVSGMSIGEYAKLQGKELLYANANVDVGGISQSYDCRMEKDGTMIFIISGDNGSTLTQREFVCNTQVYPLDATEETDIIRDSFTFQMETTGTQKELSYVLTDTTAAKELGIIIDEVVVIETDLLLHVEFLYHYGEDISEEQRKKNEDIHFEVLRENGEELEMSLDGGGWIQMQDDGSFKDVHSYKKQDLPKEITIQLRDVIEKETIGRIKMVKE